MLNKIIINYIKFLIFLIKDLFIKLMTGKVSKSTKRSGVKKVKVIRKVKKTVKKPISKKKVMKEDSKLLKKRTKVSKAKPTKKDYCPDSLSESSESE